MQQSVAPIIATPIGPWRRWWRARCARGVGQVFGVERELAGRFPGVLQIESEIVLSQVLGIRIRLMKLRQFAGQEIGDGRPGAQDRRQFR